MPVTKRTRFEVLRRDNHACRYCGAAAPDVKLTVDHVLPVALGGTDDPSNLVAACRDCNSGKASTSPDEHTVADVRSDALRHAERLKQAYAILVERIASKDDYCDEFIESWKDDLIAADWRDSIGKFHDMGVPIEILIDAAGLAHAKSYVTPGGPRFKYFCGIVWKKCSIVTEEVAAKEAFDGAWMTDEELTEERIAAYQEGCAWGERTRELMLPGHRWGQMIEMKADGNIPPGPVMSGRNPLEDLRELVARV